MPWKVIIENPTAFINLRYLPKDFIVVDPSKISVADARTLLDFWFERQEKGTRAFCFRAWYDKKEGNVAPAVSLKKKSNRSQKATHEPRHPRPQGRSQRKARPSRSSEGSAEDEDDEVDIEPRGRGDDDIDLLNGDGAGSRSEGHGKRRRSEIQTRSKRKAAEGGAAIKESAAVMKFGPPRGQPRNETGRLGSQGTKRTAADALAADSGAQIADLDNGGIAKKRKVEPRKKKAIGGPVTGAGNKKDKLDVTKKGRTSRSTASKNKNLGSS